MYKVAVEQSEGNKLTPTKGDTLASIAASDKCEPDTTWQRLALYNWGTTDPHEVNRALVELVGCAKVDEANPEKSVLDPELGTTKALYIPKAWTPPTGLAVEKTHTVKLRRRLPAPAAVLTKVDPWFIPETESCDVGFRVEGVTERADKIDFDVYASNYCKATPTADDGFFKYAFAPVDVPIRQKRSVTEATLRKSHTITDWKGESEATDGMLKPRADDKKRYVDVACSPYTVLIRYYKGDGDKDARVTLKPFWPRFKKVFKDAADTTGIDGAAEGVKAKTEEAAKAARELAAAIRRAEADIEAFVKASERAALRAHSAAKAANRAATEIATAKTAVDKAKTDVGLAKTAKGSPPGVPTAPDYNAKKGAAVTSTKDANTKSQKAHATISAAAAALAVAKAAAARAKALGATAKTSASDAATKADTAKTKADDAKGAATEPKSLKEAAEAAAEQAATTKTKLGALKSAATTASSSADTCSSDASTASGTANGAKTDTNDMWLGAYNSQTPASKGQWTSATTQIGNGATKAGTAKTKTDTTKTQATTLQTSADKARTDAAKLLKALGPAKTEALALQTTVDTTDDHVAYDKSLEVTWKVEKTDKLKHGQLLILDKEGKALFRKPLEDSDLTKDTEITCKAGADDHAKYWLDDKTKLDLSLGGMPYRAQLQAHSAWDEAEGVALVAMHTEVRLWAHKDTGTHAEPLDDSPSLHLALAPWRPDKDPPASGSSEWYKLKLAEAGFHPGPVNTAASTGDTDPFQISLAEFQRSFPKEEKKPFTRLACDGLPNGPTKDVLARTDVADKAHTKSVDVKAQTKAALEAADALQKAAEKGATDGATAQTEAAKAATLAEAAANAASQAATDADAAKTAVDKAKTDVEAADEAKRANASDASSKASTAQSSASAAASAASTAANSGKAAAEKLTAAKQAAEAAATKAGDARKSTADAATSAATAKEKADAAKKEADKADPGVKGLVDDCASKAPAAETSANTAKATAETAGTSSDTSKGDGATAEASANQGNTDAAALESAAKQLSSSAQSGAFAQARTQAATAAEKAATAKSAADQAKTDAQTFKGKADQAKTDCDKLETDADQAKTDAVALALAAKAADDAAEQDRKKKKTRKDDLDKIFRPHREMFGNPSGRADYTRAQAEPLLGDKDKDLIVWVDDRHYYTDGATIAAIAMDDYRGDMEIGDDKVVKDSKSTARPWIPLEAQLPLLGKAQALDATGKPPAVTDAMRRAIGPLRVDWTFEELPPEIDVVPDAKVDVGRVIAAYARAVTVKEKTAAALVAAGPAKTAAEPPVTRTTAAQTELGKLVTAVGDAVTLAGQAATDVAAAETAAATAKTDAEAAATAAASAASDAEAKAQKAKTSCGEAATKAAAAVQSTSDAAAKVGEAKTAAAATATEAGHAKTEAAKLVEKIDEVIAKLDDAELAAGIAASAGAVTGALGKAATATEKAKKSAEAAKKDTATADTSAGKCRDDATTATTAAELAKTRAAGLRTAAELAKGHADTGSWDAAKLAAASAATQAAEAKTAADQAKTDVGTLKGSVDEAKPELDKAKTDADEAKPDAEAIEPEAQTADAEAETDRLSREAAATSAGANVDPAVAVAQGGRARAYLGEVLGKNGMGKEHQGKLYTNCPATAGGHDYGGIRPDALDDYYKAAFGLDKTGSNRPWLAIDDTTNKVVCSVAHDDLGQDEEQVFAACLGKAGIYLNPSRIAGDGYRYRARASFWELPAGASHPNREALLQRYVRPPAAHTAGLRLWRKAAVRGYVRWMKNAVAGWDATIRDLAAYYAAAHVHFVYEGPAPTTPVEFSPVGTGDADLITAADYKKVVEDKLAAAGPYAGLSATYKAGFIWPYLDEPNWGTQPDLTDLDSFVGWLYGTIEEESWDEYSAELVHKLIEGAEKKHGRMRGHTIAEFTSSPPVIAIEYKCDTDATHTFCEIANDPGGASSKNVNGQNVKYHQRADNSEACADGGCGGSYVYSKERVLEGGIPLCAIGQALGGCWQFTPRDAWTWAHEVGHHRAFEHAQASAGETTISPGGQVTQHDSEANAYQASASSAFQRAWDRWCVMSYDDKGPVHFCGKCLLKNRGWRVETLNNPASDVQDG